MPRPLRTILVGVPHHVTQRGNHHQQTFFTAEDYEQYLRWLQAYCARYGVSIWAYCLMPNHVHLIVVPSTAIGLPRMMQMLQGRYTQYQNGVRAWSGHLWQGRYHCCCVDEQHLWTAIRYVERNPVRAGLVKRAEEYPWSSAAAHCGREMDPLLAPIPGMSSLLGSWDAWLSAPEDEEAAYLQRCTRTGFPCGDTDFVARISQQLGKELQARKPGRPPRTP